MSRRLPPSAPRDAKRVYYEIPNLFFISEEFMIDKKFNSERGAASSKQ
jgi:hypothetical protein